MGLTFILYATGRCNLRCGYCGGSFDPAKVPWRVEYDLSLLDDLVRDGDVIAYYGGEPLLNMRFIEEVMGRFEGCRHVIQTNGLLLDRVSRNILERLDAVLVSIDGDRRVTDRWRGRGVYDRVIGGVARLRKAGFSGDVVARMTITPDSDIHRDVEHLLGLGLFDHVHWQLSMIWVDRGLWGDLWGWIESSYKPGLDKLMELWISGLERGEILGMAPFQGVLKRVLSGGPTPPCGSGEDSFTVLTDGRIILCPIAVEDGWAQMGLLGAISRRELEGRRNVIDEPCRSCCLLGICGARCLYTHRERLWGDEGVEAICACSRHIIDLITRNLSRVEEAAEKGGLRLEDLAYPEYNNTVEIMP
ncbi:MAG: TIGR04084 family radical SAM/SPASM domain-containing protein [Nitrososphaerota archaeon]